MPKKKGKKKKGPSVDITQPGFRPEAVEASFKKVANELGLECEGCANAIGTALTPTDAIPIPLALKLEELDSLGPGGGHALAVALVGVGPGLPGTVLVEPTGTGPYQCLEELCFSECRLSDWGTQSLAKALSKAAVDRGVKIQRLSILMDRLTAVATEALAVG